MTAVTEQPEPIVITGAGLVTCQGLSAEETWQGVLARRRAFGPMPALETPIQPGRTGGQAPDLPADFFPGRPSEVRYLRWAIEQALKSRGVPLSQSKIENRKSKIAVVLGTTLHGIRQGGVYLRTGKADPLRHFLAGATLHAALEGLPINGPALTTCSACSSGLGAIALGMTLLRTNQADLVIAGGYDPVAEYVYAGFDSLRLVAETDTRPFTKSRDGMKIAEGYAVVVLEREDERGSLRDSEFEISNLKWPPTSSRQSSIPLARILSYGETADSHHLTQPHPEGDGARRAAQRALDDAGLPAAAIGLIAAHATGTPNNDAAESAAIQSVFTDRAPTIPVVAFKTHVGHTLGAAGATELILSMLALRDQTFPPTANLNQADLEFPIRLNLQAPQPTDIPATLNLSLGFGGSNAAMILTRPDAGTEPLWAKSRVKPHALPRPVLITGLGFISPNLIGNEALKSLLSHPTADIPHPTSQHLDDAAIARLLNARRVRRMSEYVKTTLAATTVACQDAGIEDIPAFTADAAALLGTNLGSTSFCEAYYRPIVKEGLSAANPALFAEGVPNGAAAQLSLMFQVKGPCQTIIGTRTAGLEALWLAALRIAGGEWDRAIVSAGEEFHEIPLAIYNELGLNSALSTGAVTFILESESSAHSRPARPYATIDTQHSGAVRADTAAALARAARSLVRRLDAPILLTSANGTWLDRVEALAAGQTPTRTLHPILPDLSSANAPANLAAALLTGQINGRPVDSVGVLATDYSCTAAAVRATILPRPSRS